MREGGVTLGAGRGVWGAGRGGRNRELAGCVEVWLAGCVEVRVVFNTLEDTRNSFLALGSATS